MFSLLSPIMPYLLGALFLGALGLIGYINYLRNANKQMSQALAIADAANKANVEAILKLQAENSQYRLDLAAAHKADTQAAAQKQQDLQAASQVKGSDGDTITQADLDALKSAKKKG